MQLLTGMNEMLGCGVWVALLGLMLTFQTRKTPPSSLPPLQAQSLSGARVERVQESCGRPCSCCAFSEAWKAGLGVAVPSEARQEATDWIPGPTPQPGWGLASQLPFHLAPVGGVSGSSCGAEKGKNGAHPQLLPAWLTLGKQREVGGPCAGREVL